eukprot:m.149870 g.149870  ORF g.149870 m.149870 type:complete len:55 (-) comp30687_c0_seq1:420-584(-)
MLSPNGIMRNAGDTTSAVTGVNVTAMIVAYITDDVDINIPGIMLPTMSTIYSGV